MTTVEYVFSVQTKVPLGVPALYVHNWLFWLLADKTEDEDDEATGEDELETE